MILRNSLSTALRAGLIAVIVIGLGACATGRPTDTPGVEEMGQYVRKYTGPEIEVAVGYRYAATNPGDEWLMLDAAITGVHGSVTEIERDNIWARNPKNEKIALARQEDFNQAFGELRPKLRKASIAHDPLDYFPPNRTECRVGFFATPGENVVFDQVTVDQDRVCMGRFYFRVPGGVIEGRWVLGIDLKESKIRIPFHIGEKP
jgi:hypothetical protein